MNYQNIADELNLGKIIKIQTLQKLWSDYGELLRVFFEDTSIIIKHIKLPNKLFHPKGWNTNFSQKRKINSYKIEVNFYENFSQDFDKRTPISRVLKTFQKEDEYLIVMQDLQNLAFTKTTNEANKKQLKATLKWLANFHAKYLFEKSDKIWRIGTYWHLDTRPDELKALKDTKLKSYAKKIDDILNKTKYQSFIHGDAKLANFCFSQDDLDAAAVDFQYIGHGAPIKDIIYFMSSSIEAKDYKILRPWILDIYFLALEEALEYYKKDVDFKELKKEYKDMYYIAWADFLRFIKGWSPEHFKNNKYSQELVDIAIEQIDSMTKN